MTLLEQTLADRPDPKSKRPMPVVLMDSNEASDEKYLKGYMQEYFGEDRLVVSNLPVDFTLFAGGKERLIERKKFPSDFLASISDGRLAKQCSLIAEKSGVLLLEGYISLTPDGRIRDGRRTRDWTFATVSGMLATIQASGVIVLWSPQMTSTPMLIHQIYNWFSKKHHNMLQTRTKPRYDWGSPSEKDKLLYVIQGFGVGVQTAKALLDHFGGIKPFLQADESELCAVNGVGKTRARTILKLRGDL